MNKEKIRPIYTELQGYFEEAPKAENGYFDEESIWDQFNKTIDELNEITGKNYDKFKIICKSILSDDDFGGGSKLVNVNLYRSNLAGLISKLYGEYFKDEINPLSGKPSTIINQISSQNQSVNIQMIVDLTSTIEKKLSEVKKGSKEDDFLNKLKSSLVSVKSVADLINSIFSLGKEVGLTLAEISNIFS